MLAQYFNMLQRELLAILTAGGVVPDINTEDQVLAAIQRLAGRGVTTVTNADSPKALTVAEAGLVLVDASAGDVTLQLPAADSDAGLGYTIARTDSSANVVTVTPDGTNPDTIEGAASLSLTVSRRVVLSADGGTDWKSPMLVATDAEAQAFAPGRLIDGAALAAAFGGGNQGLSVNGYQVLPGGLILQWGSAQLTGGSPYTATLPVVYPVKGLFAGGNWNSSAITGGSTAKGTFAFKLNVDSVVISPLDASGNFSVFWFSLGH
ncbi:hypothetical protein EZI54_04060 [Marinobacter halodurans]|uniref:Putative tail fiber protein gp53-like C-terminal domain-containing protein n=1 Tax=Marinobacter halodurans TaxID=2528979 RepID=A0ABY1ZPA7_9GAMM|nr:hypothetical protein [Marinobacter halodurans]TBW58567.1 hypothetical protein EZI54_04060 [Marinobacter halodurans]